MAIMLVATIKVRVGKDLGIIDRARKHLANKRVKGEPS